MRLSKVSARLLVALAVVFTLSANSAQASWLDYPERGLSRSRVVKVVKRFISSVFGDLLSDPKP